MKYKYILFDTDNTLYDFDKSESEALSLTMEGYGIKITPEQNSVYHEINDRLWKMLERGEVSRRRAENTQICGISRVSRRRTGRHSGKCCKFLCRQSGSSDISGRGRRGRVSDSLRKVSALSDNERTELCAAFENIPLSTVKILYRSIHIRRDGLLQTRSELFHSGRGGGRRQRRPGLYCRR